MKTNSDSRIATLEVGEKKKPGYDHVRFEWTSMSATMLFQSPVSQSRKYRPDIDGLRAVAVLPVVLYHAGYKAFSGGFVGVDIFFVISGFLITSILTEDIQRGGFSLASFYERRLRRIFPPLFVMAACCLVVAFVLYPPDHLLRFGKSLIAMTFFVSNLFFWREAPGGGYFAETGRSFDTDALLHTWSLSVEEQFYVFFPWALYALHRWARHREFAVLSAAIVFSFALSAWGLERAPAATFYLLTTRSWELLLGAVAAKWILRFPETRWLRETLSIIGVGLIAYAVFCFTKDTPFPGPNAIFPCVGAFLIIFAGMGGPSSVGAVLSTRPAVSIGVISYSLYLWHWPLIAFLKYFHAGEQAQLNKPLSHCRLAGVCSCFVFVRRKALPR